MAKHERAMPPVCPNVLTETRHWKPRKKSEKPTISFCGYVASFPKRHIYRLLGRLDKVAGHDVRYRTLRLLETSPLVNTKFVRRNAYWGGALKFRNDPLKVETIREQYWNNLLESDYVVCVRGAGNFSYRFYEALSAGRIPLLIDTDCVLPLEGEIDWKQHCLIVPESELRRVATRILDHFHSLSSEAFEALQVANRELMFSNLLPVPFIRKAIRTNCAG